MGAFAVDSYGDPEYEKAKKVESRHEVMILKVSLFTHSAKWVFSRAHGPIRMRLEGRKTA